MNLQDNITVGAGTPWLGVSSSPLQLAICNGGASGTNNLITANSDFIIQELLFQICRLAWRLHANLGSGPTATNIVKIATPNGSVTTNIASAVALNNDSSQYGSAGIPCSSSYTLAPA